MKTDQSAMPLAVVNIGQLITLRGSTRPRVGSEMLELGIVENGALLIEDGRIAAVGSHAELRSRIPTNALLIDAEGDV